MCMMRDYEKVSLQRRTKTLLNKQLRASPILVKMSPHGRKTFPGLADREGRWVGVSEIGGMKVKVGKNTTSYDYSPTFWELV